MRPAMRPVWALALLLSLAMLRRAEAATLAEVREALSGARSSWGFAATANKWLELISNPASARNLKLDGKVTILLSSTYFYGKYKLYALTTPRLYYTVFNMHIIPGWWPKKVLLSVRTGAPLPTKSGYKIRRGYDPKGITLRVNGKINGPRSVSEVATSLVVPDFYVGPNVVVHAVNGMLTPQDWQWGPYSSAPV